MWSCCRCDSLRSLSLGYKCRMGKACLLFLYTQTNLSASFICASVKLRTVKELERWGWTPFVIRYTSVKRTSHVILSHLPKITVAAPSLAMGPHHRRWCPLPWPRPLDAAPCFGHDPQSLSVASLTQHSELPSALAHEVSQTLVTRDLPLSALAAPWSPPESRQLRRPYPNSLKGWRYQVGELG